MTHSSPDSAKKLCLFCDGPLPCATHGQPAPAQSPGSELLPCPFCGFKAKHIFRDIPLSKWKYVVACGSTTCGAEGSCSADKKEAAEAWNRRSAPAQAAGAPEGYTKLPDGVTCKCFKMWQDGKGGHWCCLPAPPQSVPEDNSTLMETVKDLRVITAAHGGLNHDGPRTACGCTEAREHKPGCVFEKSQDRSDIGNAILAGIAAADGAVDQTLEIMNHLERAGFEIRPAMPPAVPQGVPEALAVLRAYEQWEADIILENKCWTGQNVQLTDDLYRRMIELQDARNAAISALTRPERHPLAEKYEAQAAVPSRDRVTE